MLLYVGPGAGIALTTTVLVFLVSLVLAMLGILLFAGRLVLGAIRRKRPPNPARLRRAVLIGLDGIDPDVVTRLMDAGRLPNLKRIAARGTFRKLDTTYPAISPVAWSTFATGVNPAKHGIFDFLAHDPRTYAPELSSAEVRPSHRHLRVGGYRIPLGRPRLRLLRKSVPFWKILGQHRVPCSILRVPITFPAEPFDGGALLSAMCVPDLEGSQGTFTHFTSAAVAERRSTGGRHVQVEVIDDQVRTALEGPPNPIRASGAAVRLPLVVRLDRRRGQATVRIGRRRVVLEPGRFTGWIEVAFPLGLGLRMRGICRMRLLELEPGFRLYVSPIQIDPARPVLPISHPSYFSVFLARLIGRYATLGLAEDTWALSEGVLDEEAFLEQAWDNHREREQQFFEMLRRTPRGVTACVFDGTDRIQHMFTHYADDGHPAAPRDQRAERYRGVIDDTYARMDEMVGRVLAEVDVDDPGTLLVVLSDHGFKSFRRGVNLNAWLREAGYLTSRSPGTEPDEWLRAVDWSATRAFALGLGGIVLNVRGRQAQGIVDPADAAALAEEIAGKLKGLRDPQLDAVAIRDAYPAHRIYRGPYRDQGPDLIVGYADGWRASWKCVRGVIDEVVFDDNLRSWSGDHCIDPALVPGVLIASQPLAAGDRQPSIADLAPTLLAQFGVPPPRHMDGVSLAS